MGTSNSAPIPENHAELSYEVNSKVVIHYTVYYVSENRTYEIALHKLDSKSETKLIERTPYNNDGNVLQPFNYGK